MGSEADVDPSSTPKLSLYSLPSKPKPNPQSQSNPPPGSLTPPLHSVASIPFHWEEVPGKARAAVSVSSMGTTCTHDKSRAARCLELPPPPRLLLTDESSTITSPKTVLEGPYNNNNNEGRRSFSLMEKIRDESSSSSRRERRWLRFSSWRWGSFKDSSLEFSTSGLEDDSNKVKMTRVRRRSSFLSFPNSSSLVASIYGSLKQAVPYPWRRRN